MIFLSQMIKKIHFYGDVINDYDIIVFRRIENFPIYFTNMFLLCMF